LLRIQAAVRCEDVSVLFFLPITNQIMVLSVWKKYTLPKEERLFLDIKSLISCPV